MASPVVPQFDLITVTVLVDGTKIPDVYQLMQVQVQRQINRIPWAKIMLLDGNPSEETFDISESDHFVPGKEVEIKAGYHSQDTSVFKGIVVKHGLKIRGDGTSVLTVLCYDKAVKMTVKRNSSYYVKKSSQSIVQDLISAAGLTADVGSTGSPHDEMIQYASSDWDFVVSRAEANGQIVVVQDGTVTVKAPDFSADCGLLIKYGESMIEAEAEMDARSQLSSVTSKAWDFSGQSVLSSDSSEPTVNAQGNLTGKQLAQAMSESGYDLFTAAPLLSAQLKSWADAQLLKSRLARIRGKVSFPGNAKPVPGKVIELAGLGARFNGKAFISSVTHRIEQGDWVTELEFGLSPRWFVEEQSDIETRPAAGLLPSVHGLQIGKVKKIHDDPGGETRIQVDVPMINPNGDGVWARIGSGYATKNAGIFFMPEIDDEVILSFVNNDPSFPVILGNLYSSQRTSPFTPDQKNTNKAIVSNSQLKITMDDDKKIIQIKTPGGHIVTLSDDQKSITIVDSNNNKMEMTSSGIALTSPSDIKLKATGQIQLEAQTSVSIKAGTDLTIEGLNVNAKAQLALSAQGQAKAELTASGQVTVRGAMVMIN